VGEVGEVGGMGSVFSPKVREGEGGFVTNSLPPSRNDGCKLCDEQNRKRRVTWDGIRDTGLAIWSPLRCLGGEKASLDSPLEPAADRRGLVNECV
jgi:hypothetical protein